MENTNIITNIKPKKPISDAQKRAQQKYMQKIKDNEEHKEYKRLHAKIYNEKIKDNEEHKAHKRENAKKYYERNKEHVINRVRNYQNRKINMAQLERLHELKEQGLIKFDSMSDEGFDVLLDNLKILGL